MSASDPQCSTLLEDGTRCALPGTNGNPDKPTKRCKAHNKSYQEGYRAYKEAGNLVVKTKAEQFQGRIPGGRELKRIVDTDLLDDMQLRLGSYRDAVQQEMDLREKHTGRFMLTCELT